MLTENSDILRMLVGVCNQLELNGVPVESLGVIGLSAFWADYQKKELEAEQTRIVRRRESIKDMPTIKDLGPNPYSSVYRCNTPVVDEFSKK